MALRQKIRRGCVIVALLLFPITMFYFSPGIVFLGARLGVVNGSLILFGLQFVAAMLLGRAFCAWCCPAAGLGEVCIAVNSRPARIGKADRIKWFIWVPWLISLALVLVFVGGGYHAIDPLLGTRAGVSMHEPRLYRFYYLVLGLVMALAVIFGRRAFCHYLCWMAPFMILGRKLRNQLRLPALQLRGDASACSNCKVCTRNCPMSLPVHAMVQADAMEHPECVLCGTCVDSCPRQAVRFAFARPYKSPNLCPGDGRALIHQAFRLGTNTHTNLVEESRIIHTGADYAKAQGERHAS